MFFTSCFIFGAILKEQPNTSLTHSHRDRTANKNVRWTEWAKKKQRVAIDFGKLHQSLGKWNDCVCMCVLAWACSMNGVKKFPLCSQLNTELYFFLFNSPVWFCLFCRMYNSPIRRVFFFYTQLHSTVSMFFMCVTLFFSLNFILC